MPRGTFILHYKVNEQGGIEWVNLIIATGHNNLAINRSISQVSRHYVHGKKLTEGMLNRVQAVVRAYDPCLSCSTHALGKPALRVELVDPKCGVLDEVKSCRSRVLERGGAVRRIPFTPDSTSVAEGPGRRVTPSFSRDFCSVPAPWRRPFR